MSRNDTDPAELFLCQQRVAALEAELAQARSQLLENDLTASAQMPQPPAQANAQLLSMIAQVANLLLRSPDYAAVLPEVVKLLGEAVGSDRCGIGQMILHPTSGEPAVRLLPEWCKTAVLASEEFSPHDDQLFLWKQDAPFIAQQLEQGNVVNCLVKDLPDPDRRLLAAQGNTAELFVPILIHHQCWGFIAFDNCCETRLYDEAEVAILKIAADSIAAAIERQAKDVELRNVQKNLLQTEQRRSQELEHLNTELIHAIDRLQTRDRLLEVTAMAANALLTLDDFDEAMNTTLKIMGEALQTDRVKVLEHFFENQSSDFPNYSVVTYEWVTPDTIPQMTHPTSAQIDARDADITFMQTVFYDGFGGLLHEWDPTLWAAFEAVQAKAIYCVPIRVNDRVWGSFIFDDCHEVKQRSPMEMAILKIGANCIGSAIERKRSQQHLLAVEQQRAAELAKTNRALKNSLDRLATTADLDAFLGYILLEIVQQFNLDLANLYLYDAATKTLSLKLQIQDQQVKLQPRVTVFDALLHCSTSNSPIWRILLATKRPLMCDRQNGQTHLAPSPCGHQADELAFQIEVHLLLTLGDEPIGLVSLGANHRAVLTLQELELAQSLTHQVTLAIQLTCLAEEARQNSLLQERNRIAQDIHDTLAQAFGGILIQLQATQYFLNRSPEKAVEQFNVAIALAREGLAEARRSVWTLYHRSADYQSLEVALPQLVERLTQGNTVQTSVTVEGTPYRLDPEVGQNLLRLAQEALNNALRHAHAQIICLTLGYEPDRLFLSVRDDGRGFDPNQPINGFGISNMKQRAEYLGSTLTLTSQPGTGTEVAITISTTPAQAQFTNLADYLPPGGASKVHSLD